MKLLIRLILRILFFKRKKRLIFITLAMLFLSTIHFTYKTEHMEMKPSKPFNQSDTKRILYWNQLFWIKDFGIGTGHQIFEDMACKASNCEIFDRLHGEPDIPHEDFDAIVFYGMDFMATTTFLDKPKIRRPNQRYIFYMMEPPGYFVMNYKNYAGFFNWTWTYRRDSDIFFPHGRYANISMIGPPDASPRHWLLPILHNITVPEVIYEKTKLVSSFVSHCDPESKRNWYIDELAQYIEIDIYGLCGLKFCRFDDLVDCTFKMEKIYKFSFAFENSICRDYITERFFLTMQTHVVPIVLGGGDYKDAGPPMSYIDVRDFESPAKLAEYLLYLDKHPREYAKYFWWKKYYEYYGRERISVCQLCEKLNDPNLPAKVYPDLDTWWTHGKCTSHLEYFDLVNEKWHLGDNQRYFNLLHLKSL